MDTYKDINRALTIQNQELRQQVAHFKHEIVELNRSLMSEKQLVQILNRRYVQLIADISKLCNGAMRDFNQSIEEILPESSQARLSETSQNKSGSRKSVRLVPPTMRSVQMKERDKENINPLADDTDHTQVSYVQIRRKRKDDSSSSQSEYIPQSYVETINSSANFERSKNSDKSIEEVSADSVRRDIHTITEERTSQISQSVLAITDVPAQSLSHSSIVEESIEDRLTSLPEVIAHAYRQKDQQIPSIIVTHDQSNQESHSETQENISTPAIQIEDTIFDNFRTLKAVCSTPYKPTDQKSTRKCTVKIKRLSNSDLQRFGIKINDNKSSNHKIVQNLSRKNHSPLISLERVLSPRIPLPKVSIERLNEISDSKIMRPKRNAAPMNLKEPKINKKLRRPL